MSDPIENPRITALKARRAAEAKEAADLRTANAILAANVGKSFDGPGGIAKVIRFEPFQLVGGERGTAFLVEFGNPNCHQFISTDEFLADYKEKA